MSTIATPTLAGAIGRYAHSLTGGATDFDPLLRRIGDAHFVLIGEASHGTHEFYRIRAEITKRLIREKGFTAVAVEADWPDAFRINRFVRGRGGDHTAADALRGFERFPQWMWRNADVVDFVGWLRQYNESAGAQPEVGFYGLDVYSLHASMTAVVDYLRQVDPAAARRATDRYACFDQFGPDLSDYGWTADRGGPTCEAEVVAQLVELRHAAGEYAKRDGRFDPDTIFFTEQNARVVRNAERYYRAMIHSGAQSWNVRDRHMAETLEALVGHLRAANDGREPRVVVWAHNSHLGDARATEMTVRDEVNVGQLVRERHGADAVSIGFTTYAGSVTAATNWGGPADRKIVRPALHSSYEALFHQVVVNSDWPAERAGRVGHNFLLVFERHDTHRDELRELLGDPMLERAIGVIYRPGTERQSHYFNASLPRQFDAVLHYDVTRAVEPLERTARWDRGEAPETYPSAL
jgi:erythromycin esterase-like protein